MACAIVLDGVDTPGRTSEQSSEPRVAICQAPQHLCICISCTSGRFHKDRGHCGGPSAPASPQPKPEGADPAATRSSEHEPPPPASGDPEEHADRTFSTLHTGRSSDADHCLVPACSWDSHPRRSEDTTQRGIKATPFPALLRSRGRPSPLHRTRGKGSFPPHGSYREGRTAAPPRTLPRTVRSGRDCRLFYAPHSMDRLRNRDSMPPSVFRMRRMAVTRTSLPRCESSRCRA